MRATLLLLIALSVALVGADPPPRYYVRSRLLMRLDPAIKPDPDGSVQAGALGSFQLMARDDYDVEASGWIGHQPGATARYDDIVSGDVSVLRLRTTYGAAWLEAGRHWTTIGGQRFTRLTGVTAGVDLDPRFQLAARAGFTDALPGDVVGGSLEYGGAGRWRATRDLNLTVGVLSTRPEDGPLRTRLTVMSDYEPGDRFQARGAATVDAQARAVVEARAELYGRAHRHVWLRGYGRYAEINQLLPFGDLLAVFAPDPRGEAGAVVEWLPLTALRLRLDGAWVGVREDHVGGRWRAGADVYPRAGAQLSADATARTGVDENSALLRLAGRWPLYATVFATAELLGDAVDRPGEDPVYGGASRIGAGFEPWLGWFAYGAVELARSERWPERVAGLILLEHALGAPVRWGGAP